MGCAPQEDADFDPVPVAERAGWTTEQISASEQGIGGVKEVVFQVSGVGAYSQLKHESGVHRVQRVPETESQGRIHTSTATSAPSMSPSCSSAITERSVKCPGAGAFTMTSSVSVEPAQT